MELTDREKSLLDRIIRQKNMFLMFSIASVLIALSLGVYYGLIVKNLNSPTIVLIVLILLAGRSHMRQYRSAVILGKLKRWLERKDR